MTPSDPTGTRKESTTTNTLSAMAGVAMEVLSSKGSPPRGISTQGGGEPVWGPRGRELFYRQGDRMWVVPIDTDTGPTFRAGKPQIVFEGHYATNPYGNPFYDVAPDGQRFLMVQPSPESTRSRLHVLVDWRNN